MTDYSWNYPIVVSNGRSIGRFDRKYTRGVRRNGYFLQFCKVSVAIHTKRDSFPFPFGPHGQMANDKVGQRFIFSSTNDLPVRFQNLPEHFGEMYAPKIIDMLDWIIEEN